MKDIIVIKKLDDFIEEIHWLYAKICSEHKRREKELEFIGLNSAGRIRFEELDLSLLKQNLLSVHKTLQWREHNDRLSLRDAQKARFVAIAGMCELIKDEYVGKFWNLYEKIIGWDKDNTVYEWIWEQGFNEVGIEMLGDGRREFVQTLIMESGVPKNRAVDIVSFFEIYWRYLREQDVLIVIQDLRSDLSFAHIPRQDRSRLISLSSTASEYTRAFAMAVSRLSAVFEYVSTSDEIIGGSIDDWAGHIFKAIGINPLTILRDGEQLQKLYKKLLGIVTPAKLLKIIDGKPPGTEISCPDGRKQRTDYYKKIQFGRHKIDGALFTCLPDPGMDLLFLSSQPVSKIIQHGDSIILRSISRITPVINGTVRTDLVNELFLNKKSYGYIFYCLKKTAMEIGLCTADGRVNAVLSGKEGFVCYPYFHYQGDRRKQTHFITVRVNSIKLAATGLKNQKFSFVCNHENKHIHKGTIDNTGRAACAERSVLLESPEPGDVVFAAIDETTDEYLVFPEGEAKATLSLAEVMLFSPYSHRLIKPRASGVPFQFGSNRFVLFTASRLDENTLQLENCEMESTVELGDYKVHNLIWKNQLLPCRIQTRISREHLVTWAFEKCLHFTFYINRKNDNFPDHIIFRENQGSRPTDFDLVLYPFPQESMLKRLFWNIIVNNSPPLKIPLSECRTNDSDDKSMRILGKNLEKMLLPLWNKRAPENALVEISLCAMDETLASRNFLIFPNLKLSLPDGVHNGDTFPVQINLGVHECREFFLKNNIGRSKVKIRFTYENLQWQLRRQKFKGSIELEHFGTSLDIEAIPPYRAIRFGHKKNGKVEPVRDILKRELGPYDLLIVGDRQQPPEIVVNGHQQKISFKCIEEGFWQVPMLGIPAINKQENPVTVQTPEMERPFTIKYRTALVDNAMIINKYVIAQEVTGSCSFRGPVGSHVKLSVSPVMEGGIAGNSISIFLYPNGEEINDYSFAIKIPDDFVNESIEHYELSAFLVDNPDDDKNGHEYGERWEIFSVSAVNQNDFMYLKERIIELLEAGRLFAAARDLSEMKGITPKSEKEWVKVTGLTIKQRQLSSSLNKIASQISDVLNKQYLFKV